MNHNKTYSDNQTISLPDVMKLRPVFFLISLSFLIPGIISLFLFGLQPAIDFTGGSLLELEVPVNKNLSREDFESVINQEYEINAVQKSGQNQYILRGKEVSNEQKDTLVQVIDESFPGTTELRFETVGPTLGKELMTKTITAILIVSGMITLYIAWRFDELKYGVSAVLAMFHDSLILLGSFSLFGYFFGVEVDVLFVTALLTTLSFSIHDTIVVYDRIREKSRKVTGVNYQDIVNAAVIETLGRSINNSITIIVMLLSLALLGGETIRWFSVALLIGAVTGTYSSTFTAAPLLLLWDDVQSKIKKKK